MNNIKDLAIIREYVRGLTGDERVFALEKCNEFIKQKQLTRKVTYFIDHWKDRMKTKKEYPSKPENDPDISSREENLILKAKEKTIRLAKNKARREALKAAPNKV